jgi:hypothetical protein
MAPDRRRPCLRRLDHPTRNGGESRVPGAAGHHLLHQFAPQYFFWTHATVQGSCETYTFAKPILGLLLH